MTRVSLSDRTISTIPLAVHGQTIIRDSDLPGFFVMVGTRSKAFMVQGDLRQGKLRQSLRLKVGEVGRLTTREARARAKALLGQISEGIDPRPKSEPDEPPAGDRRDPTLRAAWGSYRESHMRRKGRSEKTIRGYGDHVERLMVRWLDQPLSVLGNDPSLVKDFHDEITHGSGPYMANCCMRTLRAVYNHARKAARGLPTENPVFAVDWNPEYRRDTGLGMSDLALWFDQLRALENPLRREMHLFLLLSGSRPEVIKRAKLEHLNLRERWLFVPEPKGGVRKAFYIPLSREMIMCALRAMRLGRLIYPENAAGWLFPADSDSGHIVEHRESRDQLSHWGNELRQTYRTVGQIAGVGDVDMHLLMNHSLPGVNAGYITRNKLVGDHLRSAQQKISSAVTAVIKRSDGLLFAWPFLPCWRSVPE
jgi:Arm DNA-binding domain